jgi:hypothetical protein
MQSAFYVRKMIITPPVKQLATTLCVLSLYLGILPQTSLALSTHTTRITSLPTASLTVKARQSTRRLPALSRQQAQDWQLTTQEWQHYQRLMRGVAGHWYIQLDPPEVLGLLASTPEARKHYAEIVVAQQKARIDRELAFNRAVQSAWQTAYPHLLPIAAFDTRPFQIIKPARHDPKKAHP